MKVISGLLMAAALSGSVAFAANKISVVDIVNASELPITVTYRMCPSESYSDVHNNRDLQKCNQEQSVIVNGVKSSIQNGNVAYINTIEDQEFFIITRLQNSNGSNQNSDNSMIGYANGPGFLLNDFGTSKIYIQDLEYANH